MGVVFYIHKSLLFTAIHQHCNIDSHRVKHTNTQMHIYAPTQTAVRQQSIAVYLISCLLPDMLKPIGGYANETGLYTNSDWLTQHFPTKHWYQHCPLDRCKLLTLTLHIFSDTKWQCLHLSFQCISCVPDPTRAQVHMGMKLRPETWPVTASFTLV